MRCGWNRYYFKINMVLISFYLLMMQKNIFLQHPNELSCGVPGVCTSYNADNSCREYSSSFAAYISLLFSAIKDQNCIGIYIINEISTKF